MDHNQGLEIRLEIADRLRPNGGLEAYYFGTDPDFIERIDGDWQRLYFIIKRDAFNSQPVKVTNL